MCIWRGLIPRCIEGVDFGVDFPWLLTQISNQAIDGLQEGYQKGARLRWLLGDLDRLNIIWKSPEYDLKQKLLNSLTFLQLLPINNCYEVIRLEDTRPFFYELKEYCKDIFC